MSSRLQPSRIYQERRTSFYSASHFLVRFHDSAQDVDNTRTAPAFFVYTRNFTIRITWDHVIVALEKKHSILFPATARILIGIQFAGALVNEPHSTRLENVIEHCVAGNSSEQVREKCGYPEEITFPHETRRWLQLGLSLKGVEYVKCLTSTSVMYS